MENSGTSGNFPTPASCCSHCECQGRSGEDGASCETAWALQKRTAKSIEPYFCAITWDPGWRVQRTAYLGGHNGTHYETHGKCRPNASAIFHREPNRSSAAPCDQNGS